MKKLLGIAVVTLLLVLSGCGGGNDSSTDKTTAATTPTESTAATDGGSQAGGAYCDALNGAKTNLASLDLTQIDEKTYATLQVELAKVSAAAPPDVQDDWAVLTKALDDLHKLLADIGISFDDLQGLSTGQVPPGVSAQDLQKLGPKLTEISSDGKLEAASKAITESAQADCGLTLG
ncbi:MAG: hypothetical protein WAK18_01280 [Nocardioidaceae bacterium]